MLELLQGLPWLLVLMLSLLLAVPALLLLAQVVLALLPDRTEREHPRPERIAVVMPAHNEGRGLRPTLMQAMAQLGPQDRILVVADNCTDDTAAQAREFDVTVVERTHATDRGKGFALDFGVRHLEALAIQEGHAPDVVVILDADCELGPRLLPRIASVAHATGRPVQATYLMEAANDGLKARIAEFAMRVKNLVRPRGMHQLGLPCGLYGTGMAFPWAVAVQAPLASGHLAEDMQLGVRLAQLGAPPLLCEDALVTSVFAKSQEGAASQRTRWEHGHLAMLVGEGPRLLWRSMRPGRGAQLLQVLDMLVPPLTLLALMQVGWLMVTLLLAVLLGWWAPMGVALLSVLMLVGAIVIAQQRWADDILSLSELAGAPLLLLSKVPLYLRFVFKRQVEWVRTKRDL
ncbi:glycosyltransferase family 2 protein [Roseateles depolymerans]|uniref:Glycosyl transferase family 2 n=1 Tax=Roseateles depolymerans TaxID=76731 RepID=A0A0U3E503_9BURK|nr:glycosyltransferase family 2 protein [Roseateles depolymerans]ALV08325.1 Glycosyl transferase family 2 [Roseateles depolymerans]REG21451.1 cellulose synthase/poly-beta-1,6-N-acetylglucosamine synthase-like glycosyltransferase [Roseateles depolymerans]